METVFQQEVDTLRQLSREIKQREAMRKEAGTIDFGEQKITGKMQKEMLKKLKSSDLKDVLKRKQSDKKSKKTSFMIAPGMDKGLGDSIKPRLSQA